MKDSKITYDIFYENKQLGKYLETENVCIDLYNNKQNYNKKRYWLTTGIYDYKVLHSYGLIMKPHEMNVIYHVDGNQIFLYDTYVYEKNVIKYAAYEEAVYDMGLQVRLFSFVNILLKGKIRERFIIMMTKLLDKSVKLRNRCRKERLMS